MRFLSLFSGIESASVAWGSLGWECVGVAEIEPFPCAVLKHHYPSVQNLGDVTKITQEQIEALGHIDVVIYGFPCQDLSMAGNRKGLKNADGTHTRSGLFYVATKIIGWSKARWSIAENVPGLLSSNKGRDFASVVGELAGAEFGVPRDGWRNSGMALGKKGLVEWATLDAQFFGVPQRRRRVFIVRDSGDWQSRPPLLLIRESLSGDPPPSREAGKGFTHDIAPSLTNSGRGVERSGDTRGQDPVVAVCMATGQAGAEIGIGIGTTLNCNHEAPIVTHSLRGEGFDASEDGTGRGTPLIPCAYRTNAAGQVDTQGDIAAAITTMTDPTSQFIAFSSKDHGADAGEMSPTLRSMGHDGSHANGGGQIAVAFNMHKSGNPASSLGVSTEKTDCLRAFEKSPFAVHQSGIAVRRLVVTECERLMGFPDGYTKIPSAFLLKLGFDPDPENPKHWACDGPRYKALGNSMAVPVVRWIGERIQQVEDVNP